MEENVNGQCLIFYFNKLLDNLNGHVCCVWGHAGVNVCLSIFLTPFSLHEICQFLCFLSRSATNNDMNYVTSSEAMTFLVASCVRVTIEFQYRRVAMTVYNNYVTIFRGSLPRQWRHFDWPKRRAKVLKYVLDLRRDECRDVIFACGAEPQKWQGFLMQWQCTQYVLCKKLELICMIRYINLDAVAHTCIIKSAIYTVRRISNDRR
jgi:ribonuclease HI